MSPESLVAKEEVGPSTDIYALGCLLYEMLSGNPPFWQGSDFQILSAHVSETPNPIWKQRPELRGRKLSNLIDDMLRKRPEERPASMQIVREELQAALMELVEEGVPSADYIPGALDWSRTSGESEAPITLEHTIRLTGVVPRLREAAPNSTASELLNKLPETVSGSLLSLALWEFSKMSCSRTPSALWSSREPSTRHSYSHRPSSIVTTETAHSKSLAFSAASSFSSPSSPRIAHRS